MLPQLFPQLFPHLLPRSLTHIAFILVATTLAGCATVRQLVAPAAAPNSPPAVRQVSLRLHAAARLNTDSRGQPLALLARVYQLRQRSAFEQAPFESFMSAEAERAALGADLVEVKEVVLVPGQRYETQETLAADTAYVGVVGLFHAPARQRWRMAFAGAAAASSGITIGAHGCALAVGAGAAPLTPFEAAAQPCR